MQASESTSRGMSAASYQEATKQFAIYPSEKAIEYLALGLSSEAGEVCGKVKKFIRDKTELEDLIESLNAELSDVLWYISQLCNTLGLSLEDVMQYNIDKLQSRAYRNKLGGSGDER